MPSSPTRWLGCSRRYSRPLIAVVGSILIFLGIGPASSVIPAAATEQTSLFGTTVPSATADADTAAVELGVKFSSNSDGMITAIRFYKSSTNVGAHPVTLWSEGGQRMATTSPDADQETESGWQTVRLADPVHIDKGRTYVASYHAPNGQYAADAGGFDRPYTAGPLTVPAGGGVYQYGEGGFPTDNYANSNYYVDVLFQADNAPSKGPAPAPPQGSGSPELNLPRIPSEGGSTYWKQFPKADAAGWSDPHFFPIVVWYNGISNNDEVQYDKDLGINTYIGMWEGTPYRLFEDNNVFWIGDKLNSTFTDESRNWVGDMLADEVDGKSATAAQGRAELQSAVDKLRGDGRFKYANFTQMVISKDMNQDDAQQYVNNYTDAVSLDMYWYTVPFCSWVPYSDVYLDSVKQSNCRTASSYGKTMTSLRQQDAADGKLQPLWQLVENLNGGPGEGPFVANITPGQLKGAVMNSVINEARGIVYFNQSLSGSCTGGSIFRQSQVTPDFCGASQVAAAKEVNAQIKQLAPILNSQSYQYSFGPGLDTMLKAEDGSAYIFAMVDGDSQPGQRTLQLPEGVNASSVEVLYENRTLPVSAGGQFRDNFDTEYSYHIYKVALG